MIAVTVVGGTDAAIRDLICRRLEAQLISPAIQLESGSLRALW